MTINYEKLTGCCSRCEEKGFKIIKNGYFHTDLAISSRLTAVETHQQDTTSRLDRIENKLDQALQVIVSK